MKIRVFEDTDLAASLALNHRSGHTKRSEETWKANRLTSILALDNLNLIGAIPLEPKSFSIAPGRDLNLLWVTAAFVEAKYRSQGIGSMMDRHLRESFYAKYDGVFVYREDENSAAYKWYSKLGYRNLLPIVSFKKDVSQTSEAPSYKTFTKAEFSNIDSELLHFHQKYSKKCFGFPKRTSNFWSQKIETHYYREFYSYTILKNDGGFVLLGETTIRDQIARFDILDFEIGPSQSDFNSLMKCVFIEANKRKLKEVRIQLSTQDPIFKLVQDYGFSYRWRTNLMGLLFNPQKHLESILTKENIGFNFSFSSPSHPRISYDDKKNQSHDTVKLFMTDEELERVLLFRSSLKNSIEEGRTVLLSYKQGALDTLNSIFKHENWSFRQIDYI